MFESDRSLDHDTPPAASSVDDSDGGLGGHHQYEPHAPVAASDPEPLDDDTLTDTEVDELVEDAVHASRTENAARLVLLRTVARLDAVEVWKADGQTSMANWVAWKFHRSRRAARELVGVARVIDQRPELAAAFGAGRLSWEQLVPLSSLATRDTDAAWASNGATATPEDLSKAVQARELTTERARDIHERRGITVRTVRGGGTETKIQGDAADAEALRVELDRIREQTAVPDPRTGKYPTVAQQRYDALNVLVGRGLGSDADIERATVVVHTPATVLTDGDNTAGHLTDGTPVAAETIRRLSCDARIEVAVHGPDGVVLGIGRASRTWPAWLARQIKHRDRDRCRFPGCPNPIHHIHHTEEWDAHKGRTDTRNGAGVCRTHHHCVHEGKWKVAGNADHLLIFTSPDGRVFESPVPGSVPELWEPAA